MSIGQRQAVAVTGASAEVRRATARAFGQRGFAMALLAGAEERLKEATREIEERGGTALPLPADVATRRGR